MTALLALLAMASAADPAKELHVRVAQDNSGRCTAIWNGEVLDQDQLSRRAMAWPDKSPTIHIDSDADVPYNCIGGIIYTLQMAYFVKIDFIAEPPPRRVIVWADRQCRLRIDGRRVTLDALRAESTNWAAKEADVHFQSSPKATYQCVAPVLKILKDAGVGKMGFVGNERFEPSEGTSK
jgi:biopolymer transport protein ExbD